MLHELFSIIEDRKNNPRDTSYTARLLAGGEDGDSQKGWTKRPWR